MAEKPRHEYKFALSQKDYLTARSRLRAVLRQDPHTGERGGYTVSSVYFDDPFDRALREKLDGVEPREKFRLRYYNGDLSFFSLEKKAKRGGLCYKQSDALRREEGFCLLQGDFSWARGEGRPVVRELSGKWTTRQLRPRVLVEYFREPFLFSSGNVRVTLDSSIHSRLFVPGSSLERLPPACPTGGGTVLMEVKYDEFLPELIRDLVRLSARQASSFSKYAACRIFG